jgi:flagellin
MVALQSLQSTESQLSVTQKQISTGFRVADSTDDGAAFAVAQGIRSTVGALTSANQQLGNATGLLTTSQSALTDVSNLMGSMRDVLVKLGDGTLSTTDRSSYQAQYSSILANVKSDITGATYEGKTLIGNIGGTAGYGTVAVAQDGSGGVYNIAAQGASALYNSLAALTNATAGAVNTALGAAGNFTNQLTTIGTSLNTLGANINNVNNQITYNNDKVDALNAGLGSLVDADLAK